MSEIKSVKEKDPRSVNHLVLITGSQLLKQIHISKLERIVFSEVVVEPNKQSILVEIIVYDLLSKVDMQLIIEDPIECTFVIQFPGEWPLYHEIIPDPEIEIVAVC